MHFLILTLLVIPHFIYFLPIYLIYDKFDTLKYASRFYKLFKIKLA